MDMKAVNLDIHQVALLEELLGDEKKRMMAHRKNLSPEFKHPIVRKSIQNSLGDIKGILDQLKK